MYDIYVIMKRIVFMITYVIYIYIIYMDTYIYIYVYIYIYLLLLFLYIFDRRGKFKSHLWKRPLITVLQRKISLWEE